MSGWDNRVRLQSDIPATGSTVLDVFVSDERREGCQIEVSLVEESKFWLHDLGRQPAARTISPANRISLAVFARTIPASLICYTLPP